MPLSTTRPFDLVEDRGVRGVELVGAVDLARAHHVHRKRPVEHGPDLDRRRVRTENDVALHVADEQRVGGAARGVVRADVQGVEVQPGRLGLRPFRDLPAHRDEDIAEGIHERGDGMYGADGDDVDRNRDVDPLLDQRPLELGGADLSLTRREGLLDLAASLAHASAGFLAGGGRQRTDLTVGERERRPVPCVREPCGLELGHRRGRGERGERLVDHGLDGLGAERRHLDRVVVRVRA